MKTKILEAVGLLILLAAVLKLCTETGFFEPLWLFSLMVAEWAVCSYMNAFFVK